MNCSQIGVNCLTRELVKKLKKFKMVDCRDVEEGMKYILKESHHLKLCEISGSKTLEMNLSSGKGEFDKLGKRHLCMVAEGFPNLQTLDICNEWLKQFGIILERKERS